MEETDVVLMRLTGKGDEKAFEVLVSRHQRAVYNLALRFLNDRDEAEDVTQDTFIRVHRASASYTPDAKFSTWLYTIVKNLCFNVLRARKRADIVSIEDERLPELPANTEDPAERLMKEQLRERVMRAVSRLPDNMRMALLLSKYHELQYDEVAAILGCSVNAIKLRMHRARAILARELAGLKDETGRD